MKNLIIILMAAFILLFSCEYPVDEITEEYSITNYNTEWVQCYNERTGEDYIQNGTIPNPGLTSSILYEDWMNINNAYETTGIWNQVDISPLTGNTESFIMVLFEHTDGELTEYGNYETRTAGSLDSPESYTILRNVQTAKGLLLTNDQGIFEWRSNYTQPASKQAYLVIRIIMFSKTK